MNHDAFSAPKDGDAYRQSSMPPGNSPNGEGIDEILPTDNQCCPAEISSFHVHTTTDDIESHSIKSTLEGLGLASVPRSPSDYEHSLSQDVSSFSAGDSTNVGQSTRRPANNAAFAFDKEIGGRSEQLDRPLETLPVRNPTFTLHCREHRRSLPPTIQANRAPVVATDDEKKDKRLNLRQQLTERPKISLHDMAEFCLREQSKGRPLVSIDVPEGPTAVPEKGVGEPKKHTRRSSSNVKEL
jgi:hypothetical protein